jgi:hypothetical protein
MGPMPSPFSLLKRGPGRRAIPWLTYYAVAKQIVERGQAAWRALSEDERRQLQRVVRGFRHPRDVPEHDRRAVRRIVIKGVKAAARHP